MDVAASLQRVTEDILLHLGTMAHSLSGESRLCVAGGVALNCVANTRLRYEAGFDDAYFMPAASDAGTSLGAALYVAHVLHDDPPVAHPMTDYLGPGYTDEQIEQALRVAGCRFERPAEHAAAVADLLSASKIVGGFPGRAELGPRALAARTVLAVLRPAGCTDALNARAQYREGFRPFRPALLPEAAPG